MIKREIPRTNIEYAEVCKIVRMLMRDDNREYNTMRVKEAVETGKTSRKPPPKKNVTQ